MAPPINPSAIVDAVLADLLAHGFAPATTRAYAEANAVKPEDCPYLAVWCELTEYRLLTAGAGEIAYERMHTMFVSWYEANVDGAEFGGIGDPVVVDAVDAIGEALVERIAGYAGGIPGFGNQLVATLASRKVTPETGALWEVRIEFVAEEAS